jgi:hypothetical protein
MADGNQVIVDPLVRRNPTERGRLERIKRPFSADDDRRTVGLGYKIDDAKLKAAMGLSGVPDSSSIATGLGDLVDIVRNSVDCPVWNIPNIEQVRWTLAGPLSNSDTNKNFGPVIDIFGHTDPSGIDYVETTMAQKGELQTPTLICAIGCHLEPEPFCWEAQGNAWFHPGTSQQQKPPSPDVFTQNDRFNGALGPNFAGATPTQFLMPALLQWGYWANLAAWHMVRGYDLKWMIGQKTQLLDECLRHTAYMPPNAQVGSASSSQVDIADPVRRVNQRYNNVLATTAEFLKIDFIRLGSVTGTPFPTGVNGGLFRPSRAFEVVGATYGGMDLRSALYSQLSGNSEFRQLTIPYFLNAGIPIGLKMEENDAIQGNLMRAFIDATQGQNASTPPLIADTSNVQDGLVTPANLAGLTLTSALTMLELPLFPAAAAPVPQQVDTGRAVYKGGDLKVTLLVKGFEVDEDWYNTLKMNADLRNAFMCECGCGWAK